MRVRPPQGPQRRSWWPLLTPLALAVLVFARTVTFPFVNWDDPGHFRVNPLAEHPLARGLRGLFFTREIGYPAPALLLSFALDRALWGLRPWAYHAENLALHLANVGMLFRLSRRIRLGPAESCAVATLFAIHPLVVEPVSWVTGRKDVLSTALVFGAALLAAGAPERETLSAAWRWVVANVLVVLAVLVLPRAIVASVVVVLFGRAARPSWPLSGVAIRMAPALLVASVAIFFGIREITELGSVPQPRPLAGVLLDVGGAWAVQLSHVVFPVDLLAYYFRVPGDPSPGAMVLCAAVAAVALALTLLRTAPGSPIRTGAMLALVAYAPVACVFVIVRWTADSYMYLPIAALGIALVPAVARSWPLRLRRFGLCACVVYALLLALLSFVSTSRWASSASVWAGSIARYPTEPLSYEHEALGLRADGRIEEANTLFMQLAERFPDWEDTLDDEVQAYESAGKPERAREVLAHGVRVRSPACVRIYWLRLIAAKTPPDPEQRDLVATAFVNGFGAMKEGLHDPAAFRRVSVILEALRLDDYARQAAEQADRLERLQSR
jgi:protein O-mannosyl-transferase